MVAEAIYWYRAARLRLFTLLSASWTELDKTVIPEAAGKALDQDQAQTMVRQSSPQVSWPDCMQAGHCSS